jgi:anti-sigma factor RsiW
MNQELKPVSFAADGHPDEDQLLLTLEQELPPDDAARVEKHLGNCWSCRARYEEMQRGILAFVEYREKRYLPLVAMPPDDTSGFRDRLRIFLKESSPVGLLTRIWRGLIGFVALPGQVKWVNVRWVSAVAATMAGVIFWVYVIGNPGVMSASELLTRAVAAQNPPVAAVTSGRRHTVHQKMQIRSGNQTVVRDFQWTAGNPIGQARWNGQADLFSWSAPLTAEGFAGWRNSLREKKDTVKRAGNLLTLDTATSQDFIRDASIVIRAGDFHPVEQHLRFANNQRLDFIELAFAIDEEPQPAPEPLAPGPIAQAPPRPAGVPAPPGPAVPPPADLDEAELRLRYTLFQHQWDLGEDLVIQRDSGQVVLSGIVSSGERKDEMQAVLNQLPNVRFSVDVPGATPAQSGAAQARSEPAQGTAPLLDGTLDRAFSSREDRLAFVDRSLSDSDVALSHAWALRRLAERYDEDSERALKPESDRKLYEMLRAHLQQLSQANDGLAALLTLLPAGPAPGSPAIPVAWRTRISALFSAVQQQDRLVSGLVAGSQINGQNLATASANLRAEHERIRVLLEGLRDLNVAALPR